MISIAEYLKRLKEPAAAAEIYRRLGDSVAVLQLYIDSKEWSDAFTLVEQQPQYKAMVYIPYALWLAENDKFVQAQKGNVVFVRMIILVLLFIDFSVLYGW